MFHLLLLLKKYKKLRFLLIAFILIFTFAFIYWLLGSSDNFSFNNTNSTQTNLSFIDALYFAIGTHTTIGYGDIASKSQLLRGITIIQIMLLIIQITFANL
jgi:hypothetical protein